MEHHEGAAFVGAFGEADEAARVESYGAHRSGVYGTFAPMPRLVLASSSKYRAALLARAGIACEAIAPEVDERAVARSGLSPREVAETLACMKAEDVAAKVPDAFVLGGDQLVDLDGEILGKPGSFEAALAQLGRLAGKEHRLVTAIALRRPSGEIDVEVDVHRLRMRALSREEMERVLLADEPYDCAGSYKIERRGVLLFESIEGRDFTAIEGVPLMALGRLLRAAGFAAP